MRPANFLRLVVVSLMVLAVMYLLFAALLPTEQITARPPHVSAAIANDQIFAAYAYRSPVSPARLYAITTIPVHEAEQAVKADKPADPLAKSPWKDPTRGIGELLGVVGADNLLMVAFEDSIAVYDVTDVPADAVLPTAPGRMQAVLTNISTMQVPDEFHTRFDGAYVTDIWPWKPDPPSPPESPDGAGNDNGNQSPDQPGNAAANQPQTAPMTGPVVLGLLMTKRDRAAIVRAASGTRAATVIGQPVYFSLDAGGTLVASITPPTLPEAPATVAANGSAEQPPEPTQEEIDTEAAKRPVIHQARLLPGPDPATHADLFLGVHVSVLTDAAFGRKRLTPESRMYWVALRDGQWKAPVLLGTKISVFDVVPATDSAAVHMVYDFADADGTKKWKYRKISVANPDTAPDALALDIKFLDTPAPYLPPEWGLNVALAANRLHLFFIARSDRQPVHTVSTTAVEGADATPNMLAFYAPRPIGAFQARAVRDQEPVWVLIAITFLVVTFSMLMMALRLRRQKQEAEAAIDMPILTDEKPPPTDHAEPKTEPGAEPTSERESERLDAESESPPPSAREKPGSEQPLDMLDIDAVIERFGYYPGGPMIRFLALVIDFVVTIVPLYLAADALGIVIDDLASPFAPDFFRAYMLMWGIHVAYFVPMEFYFGRSIGKMMLGMRVRNEERTERPLSPWAILVRNAMRGIDYPLAITMVFSDRFQRLGDRFAHTVVARDRGEEAPDDENRM